MPRLNGMGKGAARPITIRLPAEEEAFYRRKANEGGLSLNAYLTSLLVQGAIAEKVYEFEERMNGAIAAISAVSRQGSSGLSDHVALSVMTCEVLLAEVVAAQDIQVLYRAQEAARTRLARMKAA